MKQIKAFIKPHKLDQVMAILRKMDRLTGVSVSGVEGFGRGRGNTNREGEEKQLEGFIPHARIEIVCSDDLVEPICGAIESASHTGLRGDGKIYVGPIVNAIRISTGERGEIAV